MTARPILEAELHAYADGRLAPDRAAAVESHLQENPAERQAVEAWRRQGAALREALAPVAAEPVPLRLSLLRLDRRAAGLGRWRAAIPAFAAGLVCGVVLTGLAWWHVRPTPVSPAQIASHEALARRAMGAHRTFVAEQRYPVEVRAGEAHLAAWLQRRTTLPIRLPDLSAEGFALLGGRLLPDGADGSAALLMYETRTGERLTLYLSRPAGGSETAFRYEERGNAGAFYWTDREAAYVLTGPADRDRLLRLARLVYAAYEAKPGG